MPLKAMLKAFFFFIFCSFFAVYSVSLRATSSQFFMQNLDPSPPPLPGLNIDSKRVSLSGLSSGGFMAVQLHIAFSSYFQGIGVFAGGPYYCAEGHFQNALDRCMHPKDETFLPDIQKLVDWTKKLAIENKIDNLDHLKIGKVWLFSGTNDETVFPVVMEKLKEYYGHFVGKNHIESIFNVEAGHGFITENEGNTCYETKSPFINKCGIDGAGEILRHIYGSLNSPLEYDTLLKSSQGELIAFNQHEFISDPSNERLGIAQEGYVYIPESCRHEKCGVHIFLHGCKQSAQWIGTELIEKTGFHRWADTNKLIILYPQAHAFGDMKAIATTNPMGCWDWWGYSDDDYYSRNAPQMKAIIAMINRLKEPLSIL